MKTLVMAIAALLTAGAAGAQPKKLKVYISADMEGVGGVSTWSVQAGSKGREYEKFRQLMTREVNVAIAAAFEAGAADVLVSDSHGDAQNLDVERLDRRVDLVRGWPRPLSMMKASTPVMAPPSSSGTTPPKAKPRRRWPTP
jgi:D-amino peptidase